MNMSVSDVIQFVVVYKWWIIALLPVAIAIMVIRSRG